MTVIDNTAQWKVKKVGALPHAVMSGAAAGADGASGLVPAPMAGDQDKVLKGDGTWGEVSTAGNVTGIVAITNGGTGATTTEEARTNLGAAPAYTYSTTDLTAGTSTLTTGKLYIVYE